MTRIKLPLVVTVLVSCVAIAGCGRGERLRRAATKITPKAPTKVEATTAQKELANAPEGAKPVAAKPPAVPLVFQTTVVGSGKDQQQATEHAVRLAQKELERYLSNRKPPILWVPSEEFIAKRLAGKAERNFEREKDLREQIKNFDLECWDVPITVTPTAEADMLFENQQFMARKQQQERDSRREERLVQEGKVFGVILVFLVALVGYIRLDQWTNGSCSRVLRVALMGLLVVAGVALWWSF